ncbi:MAG TPA: spore coat protein, partial [Bacillota bacterium]
EMAYEVFLYQNKHHYYQVPQLQQQDMQELINSFAPIQGGTMTH